MRSVRVIPCLDVDGGRVVKGVNFVGLRDAGDPVELASRYDTEGADEVVFLDITASSDARDTMVDVVARTADQVFIPLTVGGGVRSVEDVQELLSHGADKVSVNSAALADPSLLTRCAEVFGSQCVVLAIDARRREDGSWEVCSHGGRRPELISELAKEFGSQCVVVAIDARRTQQGLGFEVYTHGGRTPTGKDAIEWAAEAERLGAGEILLTSMDRDGTRDGFDLELTRAVVDATNIPVIASGGVGNLDHLVEGAIDGGADAVLAASIFHFGEFSVADAKARLSAAGVNVRPV